MTDRALCDSRSLDADYYNIRGTIWILQGSGPTNTPADETQHLWSINLNKSITRVLLQPVITGPCSVNRERLTGSWGHPHPPHLTSDILCRVSHGSVLLTVLENLEIRMMFYKQRMGNQIRIRLFSNLAMSPHILDPIHSQDVIKICKHNPGQGACLQTNEGAALSRPHQSGSWSCLHSWILTEPLQCHWPRIPVVRLRTRRYVTILSTGTGY